MGSPTITNNADGSVSQTYTIPGSQGTADVSNVVAGTTTIGGFGSGVHIGGHVGNGPMIMSSTATATPGTFTVTQPGQVLQKLYSFSSSSPAQTFTSDDGMFSFGTGGSATAGSVDNRVMTIDNSNFKQGMDFVMPSTNINTSVSAPGSSVVQHKTIEVPVSNCLLVLL